MKRKDEHIVWLDDIHTRMHVHKTHFRTLSTAEDLPLSFAF